MSGIQVVAEAFGVTPRRVQQLAKEGMPKGGRGDYDLVACLKWYVKYLQDKMAAGATNADGEASGRERLANAKADREVLALAEEQKILVRVTDFERSMADLITPARQELLAIEARLRPVIGPDHAARCGAEIKRSLRGLVVEAVHEH